MKSQVGVGVIGCGHRIGNVLRSIPAMGSEVVVQAVCDPCEAASNRIREEFNPSAAVYEDYHKLVGDPAVDWVAIGSWNCFHREHVIAAARAGKHIFCEKPLATNLADCLAMRDAVNKAGVILIVGFTLRFSPHYRRIKKLIDDGLIGDIISLEFNETLDFNHGGFIMGDWRRLTQNAGTHLLEKCCHDLDLVNWMVASRARRVASFGGRNFFKPDNVGHMDRLGADQYGREAFMATPWTKVRSKNLNPFTAQGDIADNQVAIIEFENDVRVTFHTNCMAGIPERRMLILGTEGAIRSDVLEGKIQLKRLGFDEELQDVSTDSSGGHGGGDVILGHDLQAAMLEGQVPPVGLDEGLLSAIIAFGIDQAMDDGRVVDMANLWQKVDFGNRVSSQPGKYVPLARAAHNSIP